METGNAEFRLKALADLNTLREARFDTRNTSYMLVENRSDIKTTTGEDLFTFCQEERRRELAFEDHRWFDLRRWGMPRLEHRYQSVRGEWKTFMSWRRRVYIMHCQSRRCDFGCKQSVGTKFRLTIKQNLLWKNGIYIY